VENFLKKWQIHFAHRRGFCFECPRNIRNQQTDLLALNTLREALDDSPENLPLRLVYARRCEDALSFGEARTVYEGILKKFPTHPSALLGIARSLFFQGKISEAVVRVERLLKDHQSFSEGHLFLSRILYSEGELAEAAVHYKKALAIDPGLAEPQLDRELAPLIRDVEPEEQTEPTSTTPTPEEWFSQNETKESPFELSPEDGESQAKNNFDDFGFFDALQDGVEKNGMTISDLDTPTITFDDVGGLDGVKDDIRMKIVHPIKNPQLFKAYGMRAGGSMLFYGPPGCGKTLVGKALDGELDAAFYSLGLHQILDAGNGRAEKQLHEIFHIAKMNAPSVLFLDEVDAIATNRGMVSDAGRCSIVNQLLKELDDVSNSDGVLVIAATSAPWLLDPAFLRPGRFDQKVLVSLPDSAERVDIVRVLRNRIPVVDLDAQQVADETAGYSGADLTAIFENAAERAISASIKIGTYQPLTTELIIEESKRMLPGAESWMEMARSNLESAKVSGSFRALFDR